MKETKNKSLNQYDRYNMFNEYQQNNKQQLQKPKKRFSSALFLLTFFCVLVCTLGVVFAIPESGVIFNKLPFLKLNKPDEQSFNLPLFKKRQNILILGVDKNPDGNDPFSNTRSDTIILLNIDPKHRSINAISIPRDSKVYIAGDYGIQKINSAHAYGGVELTKKTVENTLGVKVDRYIAVNSEAVIHLVDILGGVPVYVEKDMFYHDYSGKLNVRLPKGNHVLNGQQAEGYLRFRKDGLGDIGRTSRQQWFLRNLLTQLQTPATITKIPEILNLINEYVKTDMSMYEISNFAAMAKDFNLDNVEVATLPGAPSKKGSISYWILDPEQTQEMVDRLIYRKKNKTEDVNYQLTAGIIYTSLNASKAEKIKTELENKGYTVNMMRMKHVPHAQFISHQNIVTNDIANKIKNEIPDIKDYQFVYDPLKIYCVNSDFTLIISET
ncbi:MAG: LCP family protein [Candidatus Gastranaerophilales bacterium]|nr:LCP family protein [Candidatus Gastranaerophilales bacterium]